MDHHFASGGPGGMSASMMGSSNAADAGEFDLTGRRRAVSNLPRQFKCNSCPASFVRNHDLRRHARIHLEVKPFACNDCGKPFSRKDALKRHILVKVSFLPPSWLYALCIIAD